jgi:hypothetical protein
MFYIRLSNFSINVHAQHALNGLVERLVAGVTNVRSYGDNM